MTHQNDSETERADNTKGEEIEITLLFSSPNHVPVVYRNELIKVIAAFFDSELAASANFTSLIKLAPSIPLHINVARFVSEKLEHSKVLLKILGEFGDDEWEYRRRIQSGGRFNWSARLDRNDDPSLGSKISDDKRVAVLYYPIENWMDGVLFYVLMELAAEILIVELSHILYKPLSNLCRMVMTAERRHASLGSEELFRLAKNAEQNNELEEFKTRFNYWLSRVQANFDPNNLPYFERLAALGLPLRSNQSMLNEFNQKADELRHKLKIAM